jgi:hypothetical protein
MSVAQIAAASPAVNNPVNLSAQSAPRLCWWRRAYDYHWAYAGKGRYVVRFVSRGRYWNVDYRCGPGGKKYRRLGVAATMAAAKAIAEAAYAARR